MAKSGWWAKQPEQGIYRIITSFEKCAELYLQRNPETGFAMTYEELVANSRRVKEMDAFLGVPYTAATVDEVLNIRHSTW